MDNITEELRTLGQPIVDEAFSGLLASKIPSPLANRMLRRFSRRWTDYTRAALMVMACQAVGGDPLLVRPAAKGLVLAGGAFDLHDDIIDRSFVRKTRKVRSIQGIYGMNPSLLLGDALLIGGLVHLSHMPGIPEEKATKAVRVIRDGLFELGSAELEELRFIRNLEATPRSYLRIIRMKAADVESYTRVGAIIGGGRTEEEDALGRFGRHLGIICILRDDIEDTFNDLTELRSRLTKESLPLPVLYSLPDQDCVSLLRSIWSKPSGTEPSDEELIRLIKIVHKNRGFEKGQALILKHIKSAKDSLEGLRQPEPFYRLFQA